MPGKQWKFGTAAIFMILAALGAITLPLLTNATALAQTPSVRVHYPSVHSPCTDTDIEIQKHIQQLNKGETADFNALVGCNSKAVPALIKALENQDEKLRIITIAALGEIGTKASPALPVLNGLLKDERENIRIVVVYALGQIMGKDGVKRLIQALKDKNEDVRFSAANALGTIGKDAVPSLIIALKDPDNNIRAGAADALGRIGTDAQFAVPSLTTALKDSDSKVRSAATDALEKINAANALEKKRIGCVIDDLNLSRDFSRMLNDPNCAVVNVSLPVNNSSDVGEQTRLHLINNSLVMCKIPIIKSVLSWKCAQVQKVNNNGK